MTGIITDPRLNPALPAPAVTLLTGDTRPITSSYPDGSYQCPWCSSPAFPSGDRWNVEAWRAAKCPNPGCLAYVHASLDWVTRRLAEITASEAERERRRVSDEFHARWEAQRRAEEAAKWQALAAQATDAGQCLRCLGESDWKWGRPKLVRHRTADYHQVRDAAEAEWRAQFAPRRRGGWR